MTFIIRQITKRPSGQDIIRDRTVELDKVTVGRATGNDIFLGDLRVGLEHLIIRLSGSRVSIEAMPDKNFLLGGRSVNTATLSGNKNRSILVGPYELGFKQNDAGIWVIEVQRVEPEEVIDEDRVDDIFSLRGTNLSKRGVSWIGFSAMAAMFLVLPMLWFFGVLPQSFNEKIDMDAPWLSGGLSSGHANLDGTCEECHIKAFEHVTDASCLECHDDLINHSDPARLITAMAKPSGFDGAIIQAASFFGKQEGECADCHREHNGENGIVLENSSLCMDCHDGMSTRLADTDLLDVSDFGTDHPNFSAMLTQTAGDNPVFTRVSLDDANIADNSGLKFPHDVHLVGDGPVANQAQDLGTEFGFGDALVCEDCHTKDSANLLFNSVSMEADCQMCHSLVFESDGTIERKLPHGEPQEVVAILREYYQAKALGQAVAPTMTTRRRRPGETAVLRQVDRQNSGLIDARKNADTMVERVFSKGGACHDCHDVIPAPEGTTDFDIHAVVLVDQFMEKTRFDHERHEVGDLTCESCHAARGSDLASQVLLPSIDTFTSPLTGTEIQGCRDCHGGERAKGDLLQSACIDCHAYHDATHAPLMTAGSDPKQSTAQRIGSAHGITNSTAGLSFEPARWRPVSETDAMR